MAKPVMYDFLNQGTLPTTLNAALIVALSAGPHQNGGYYVSIQTADGDFVELAGTQEEADALLAVWRVRVDTAWEGKK